MLNRKNFIKQISGARIDNSIPNVLLLQKQPSSNKIWAELHHISFNFVLCNEKYGGIRTESG